jgi:hypothetical protein
MMWKLYEGSLETHIDKALQFANIGKIKKSVMGEDLEVYEWLLPEVESLAETRLLREKVDDQGIICVQKPRSEMMESFGYRPKLAHNDAIKFLDHETKKFFEAQGFSEESLGRYSHERKEVNVKVTLDTKNEHIGLWFINLTGNRIRLPQTRVPYSPRPQNLFGEYLDTIILV